MGFFYLTFLNIFVIIIMKGDIELELNCKLLEKTFKDADGQSHAYYVLAFTLADNSVLEVSVKGDKAKLLKLSNNVNSSQNNFWPE